MPIYTYFTDSVQIFKTVNENLLEKYEILAKFHTFLIFKLHMLALLAQDINKIKYSMILVKMLQKLS